MTRTHFLTTAALAVSFLGVGLTAANAQTFTVSGSVSGSAPTFTYSYLVTPTAGALGVISFNFSDTSITPGVAPTGFTASTAIPTSGIYQFLATASGGDTVAATFTSPDGIGGTLGATNISITPGSSGVGLVNGITPAPAPEPSQTAAFGLGLLGLSALVLTARKRSASSAV